MKRFLLLMGVLLLCISIQAQTTITVDSDHPLASQIEGLSGSHLIINGTLTAEDFALLNSANYSNLASITKLDLSGATVESVSTMADMNLSGMEYLRLPNSMTSADDVAAMKNLHSSSKNASLKMAGAFDGSDNTWMKVSLTSFKTDEVTNFLNAFSLPVGWHEQNVKEVRMAGLYGVTDLVNNSVPNFGKAGIAVWDFSGANFAECEVSVTLPGTYYAYDNQFREGSTVTYTSTYSTNAFYYISAVDEYKTHIVELTLPDVNMTSLPYQTLYKMGKANKADYLRYKNLSELGSYAAVDASGNTQEYGVIEELVIPDCYSDIDTECGQELNVRHLVIGSGIKRIHGGAFGNSPNLTDLDFGAGLSDCFIGDHAFYECNSMKHIALSEGIVSVGSYAFFNSQHLESIRLPETLLNIGDNAFNNCLALNSITIPSNVRKIGRGAFVLCPLTDIFLTTTDPEKIPIMWSAGSRENYSGISPNCSFYNSAMNGWGTIQGLNLGADNYHHLEDMTWDEAVAWYFINENGLPVLHYPKQLADKVRANISKTYHIHTKADEAGLQYGLPLAEDLDKRGRIPGADLGDENGKWTRDGWAQFLLMKEYTTDPGHDVYQKDYKDVWYTMCFPFDLTDEQLAAAFNETFNIVDFSGVQIEDTPSSVDPSKTVKQMILHFNNVAVTDYKDTDGNHFKRVMEGGKAKREKDGNYEYNVYLDDDGNQYHHVITLTAGNLDKTKTKTFVRGTSLQDSKQNFENGTYDALLIDGILATAGHPYMIHPAIGVKADSPAKRCTFAGISWLKQGDWVEQFKKHSRTVDLGIKKTLAELPDSNYNQQRYSEYEGQKYTFIGNPKMYRDDAAEAIGDEPQVPEEPVKKKPLTEAELAALRPSGEEMTEAPPVVTDPDKNSKYADVKDLFKTVRLTVTGWDAATGQTENNLTYTYLDELDKYELGEFFTHYYDWEYADKSTAHGDKATFNEEGMDLFKAYFSDVFKNNDYYNNSPENRFSALKSLASDYKADQVAYTQNATDFARWTAWQAYRAAVKANTTDWDQDAVDAEYDRLKDAYEKAVLAHTQWEQTAATYKVLIPQYAYFLGTKAGDTYPKYFRETREDQTPRAKGVWTQFTAVIIPNAASLAGLEAELDGKAQKSLGSKISYNEDYFVFDDIPQGIATLIEKIEKEEGKADVEYMDIVVSIDGKIVSRDKTTFEGLPKGVYIINGKKYYVK